MRPATIDEVVGQDHILGDGKLLRRVIESDRLSNIILYGPPGCGKTTLAEVIAKTTKRNFVRLSGVLSGVADKAKYPALAKTLLSPDLAEAGTPYMMALDIWALHQLGHTAEALAKLRAIWGGMLKLGATTFFEGYEKDFDEVKMCIFYGRPFGMSLCHAWSSAPCALLPMLTAQ